ncbi:chromosomal passenger protein [Strigomonas culicis]|nr:chromosomal passenger protein [Strigomonas culicis]|eukprot:EPY35688.1 chromosomal passenger protein [Strigomonas culicis]
MEPPQRPQARTPTPKQNSRAPSLHKGGSSASPIVQRKKQKVEWPSDVPINNALKTNSRSKVAHLTAARVAAQEGVDPDLIFTQNSGELPLHRIFAAFPKALRAIQATRNASGDWRADTFTEEEEQLYKKELKYTTLGPSQCSCTL